MHHAKTELIPSRVFHYFRPSLNANAFTHSLGFQSCSCLRKIRFFFCVNPLDLAWCNGRYIFFIYAVATVFFDQIDFISDFSALSPCDIEKKSLLENLQGDFPSRPMQFDAPAVLNEGEIFPQYVQIPVGNAVKSLMQWWCQRNSPTIFLPRASEISYSDHVFSFPNWSFSSFFFPLVEFRENFFF